MVAFVGWSTHTCDITDAPIHTFHKAQCAVLLVYSRNTSLVDTVEHDIKLGSRNKTLTNALIIRRVTVVHMVQQSIQSTTWETSITMTTKASSRGQIGSLCRLGACVCWLARGKGVTPNRELHCWECARIHCAYKKDVMWEKRFPSPPVLLVIIQMCFQDILTYQNCWMIRSSCKSRKNSKIACEKTQKKRIWLHLFMTSPKQKHS